MKTNLLSLLAACLFASATFASAATNDLSGALQKGLFEEEANRNLDAAIAAYQSVATQFDKDRKLAATAIFRLGEVYRKQGKTNEANAQYERILRELSDQTTLANLSRTLLQKTEEAIARQATRSSQREEDEEIQHIKALIKNSPDLINAPKTRLDESDNPVFGTPLHRAAKLGQMVVAKFLLENGAEVNVQTTTRSTPLLLAVQSGNRAMVEFLLQHGADSSIPSSYGSPLHVAAQSGFKAVLESLLNQKRMVDAKDIENALFASAYAGTKEIAEILLAHGANLNTTNQSGLTPLWAAVGSKQFETAKFLIERGANVNVADKEGCTPLHQAISDNQPDLLELLLQNGANTEVKWKSDVHKGSTPLHLAVNQARPEFVEMLLKSDANPNSTNDFGATPLHYPAFRGHQKIAELLIVHNGDVNAKTVQGDTPLLYAVRGGKKEMVELLLDHKADPNLANNIGETPLGSAKLLPGQPIGSPRSTYQKEIEELLVKHGADEHQQRRAQISVARDHKEVYPIFYKGTNSWNRYSLLEAFGLAYKFTGGHFNGVPQFPSSAFRFPNLAKVKIHRLGGNEEREIAVDLEAILKTGDCPKDVWLEWGDVIEIPEADHKIDAKWVGFPKPLLENLAKCLLRTVSISVKGEKKDITLAPILQDTGAVQVSSGAEAQSLSYVKDLSFWLNDVVRGSGLLRSSSDQSRVTVKRKNPTTKKIQEMFFDLEKSDPQTNLWLRDGDHIEIPERDPNALPAVSNQRSELPQPPRSIP